MTSQKTIYIGVAALALALFGYLAFNAISSKGVAQPMDATPQQVTLSGAYVCLPHADTSGPQTEECAFGLQTDEGVYYAVNFGQSAAAMQQFQSGAYITAEGFVVPKEALSTNQWAKYNMRGIFTITQVLAPAPAPAQGKLNINAVCEGALAYMTFADGASAEKFVAECKEGKHPEVIDHYKAQMGLDDGAAI